jgi:CRISPR/Cas system-associated exonuclease Cas4 (RecB family)
MIVEKLIDSIISARKQNLSSKISRYPRQVPILSDVSDCDRQIEYGVLNWQDRQMWGEDTQARLEVGKDEERRVVRELLDLGFDVIQSQEPVEIKGKDGVLIARGKIDGFIRYEKKKIPLEIKSMHPQAFAQINSLDDLQRKPWHRKYLRQIMAYMFGNDCEEGFLLITNCLGQWKLIPVYLSLEDCEYLLQRLERIHENLTARKLSERIPYSEQICDKCPFVQVCLPDVKHDGMEIIFMNGELEEKLRRREELEPLAKEFLDLDEEVKLVAKTRNKDLLVGDYSIFLRKSQRTKYEIPDEIKKSFAEKYEVTAVKIVNNAKPQERKLEVV